MIVSKGPAYLIALTGLVACKQLQIPPKDPEPLVDVTFLADHTNGLSQDERAQYYAMDEGIQYLPVDVMLSLGRPVLPATERGPLRPYRMYTELFLERPDRLGLVRSPFAAADPGGSLSAPIGISASTDPAYVPMAGLNCSTCHTSVITYKPAGGPRTGIIVDGGASLFAIDRFTSEMIFALLGTITDADEMEAFYQRYQRRLERRAGPRAPAPGQPAADPGDRPIDVAIKSPEFDRYIEGVSAYLDTTAEPPPAADGGVDLAAEQLKATLGDMATAPRTSLGPGVYPRASDLDTRYKMWRYLVRRLIHFVSLARFAIPPKGTQATPPGLGRSDPWGVTKAMLVSKLPGLKGSRLREFFNAPVTVPSMWEFEANRWVFWSGVTNSMLERNIAQGVALLSDFNWATNETTVSPRRLEAVSLLARKIEAPRWPEALFGPIDRPLADRGALVFVAECAGCHAPEPPAGAPPGTRELQYRNAGTDPNYVAGQLAPVGGKSLFITLGSWLSAVKEGAYARERVGPEERERFETGRLPVVWRDPQDNSIVAKPLHGIWATAPYLHNGSVQSVRELLTPPAQRKRSFEVGSTDYDPRDLGFVDVAVKYTGYEGTLQTVGLAGNAAAGHVHGTDLGAADKDALIEFLKAYTPATVLPGHPGAPQP
jgi:hypothetical protein